MNTKRTILFLFLLVSTAMFALIGCSNQLSTSNDAESKEKETSASKEADSEYPIVIEHAFGETVIEEKPERVATVQWANHDVVLALGVVPVGFSAANFGVEDDSGLLPWTAQKLEELGVDKPNVFQDTDGLDFEAISDSNPDVILASYSGITKEDYDILSQIAPVVAYPTSPWTTSWREQVMLNATGMGMKADGEQLIKDTESLIKEQTEKHPEMQGKKVAWVNFSATDMSGLHLYTPADPRVSFLKELGMDYPESITDMIENDTDYSLQLSAENADVLSDADIIIGYGDDSLYEAVKADSRLGQIKAIERGSVVFIGNNSTLAAAGTPNPLAISYTIDEYVELIANAIDKIDE
ncbi:iron-siderophore transport system substrate-binding protein [Cytobacillus horneckiae]|uniref:iron-siderophore ABC transporter substrate-binding protein n=1 Tax=Cytobacillus horneckiae TaxID=549687 RepID=UPI0019D0F3A2|nr:iron-siderophore ABC transporter substrate-binding protein [Cytobacillus horneckiae]MBN6888505.1 iron-siderophore ABC transporter substrate-binding protein [Cytobacillus horneckiae]MCM3180298.1 iron-siderophore ABC transporter substrate-binding protein [Cytobacillus horneckiae]